MSRHAQPRPSGGWLSLILAVVAALGGASIASNVAAGPGRVAIGWASVLAAALFLLQWRAERQTSLRVARIDHARRRDAVRLREEIAEAHHRSRQAVERSYAAVARAEALAGEVLRLTAVIRATPPSVQLLPMMTPAPVQQAPAAPIVAAPLPAPAAVVQPTPGANGSGAARPGAALELPLVASRPASMPPAAPVAAPQPAPATSAHEAPFASPTAPVDDRRARVDLRAVESRFARGA